MARAYHSGYYDGQRRAGQVKRLHIIREDGKWPGRQSMCGQPAWRVRNSTPVVLDPMPNTPPAGLTWCPSCVGHLAERMGALDLFAAELAGVGR